MPIVQLTKKCFVNFIYMDSNLFMPKKKILLVTSKFPYSEKEADGGVSTVSAVIASLKNDYDLDILFVRIPNDKEKTIDGVKNIFFEEIRHKSSNKFERRLNNYNQVSSRIIKMADNYDCIIIIHASKAFGLEKASKKVLNKIVLYPMFLSFAYKESGENVPQEYFNLERKCFQSIRWIICPSIYDKTTIIEHYGGKNKAFFVIPRSVSSYIPHANRHRTNKNRLLCIGNIKVRKQPLTLLRIFTKIRMSLPDATLTFAGEIQDKDIYKSCLKYIAENHLGTAVSFLGAVNQKQIGNLIKSSDINVCTSNLETFGRCVFEGMFGGLPTVIFNKLTCVGEFVKNGEGIFFAQDENEFCERVVQLLQNDKMYNKQSIRAIESTNFISSGIESLGLKSVVERVIEMKNEF